MRVAGLIFDDSLHYLDHLAPFCAQAKCPLVICEPELAEIASHFYPDLDVRTIPIWEVKLPKYTLTCDTQPFLQAYFPGQTTQILWLPHGNSDKGWNTSSFEALQGEIALIYGQRMIDFMTAKRVFPKIVRIGNFRLQYFRSRLAKEPTSKIFLYAPTWDDAEKNNSFWTAFPYLAARLPDDCHLWIKLHPNTVRKFGPEIEVLIGKYSKKNLSFLPDDPPIYPLLAKCSAFIGDMSSIGYDFLAFNRPMFFLNANPSLPLHKCGASMNPATFDFTLVNEYSDFQKELYRYTFDSMPNLKETLDALCSL